MDLIIFLSLVVVGYVAGSIAEKRHFASIRKREAELKDVLTFSARMPPPRDMNRDSVFVQGNVVISVDYFKRLSAGLRSLLGGRVGAYESLVDRARREAVLRMKPIFLTSSSKPLQLQKAIAVKLAPLKYSPTAPG